LLFNFRVTVLMFSVTFGIWMKLPSTPLL